MAYVIEQISLPYCTYMFYYINTELYMYTPHYCICRSKHQQNATFSCHAITIYVPKTNVLHKCHIYAKYANYLMCRLRQLYQYIYFIRTQCNQQCDQGHQYTYISHPWHIPLNKYACQTAKYTSHCISPVVYVSTPHYCTYLAEISQFLPPVWNVSRWPTIYHTFIIPRQHLCVCCQYQWIVELDQNGVSKVEGTLK